MVEEMLHRESRLTMMDTPNRETVDWAKVEDTRDMAKIVLLRVIEKLYVVRIQEPEFFVGVEEDVEWIQRKLMEARVEYSYSPEELMEVAYDFEDVIDDLIILRSASKQWRIGILGRCLLLIKIHRKLQLIKFKILALSRLPVCVLFSGKCDNYIEEIVWSEILSIYNPSVANTVVSPVEEKVSGLLSQQVIHPITKKAAMRVLDKLRSLNGYLKSLESVELDDCGMVWIEELSHVVLSAVIAIEDFINKKQQLTERSWMRPFRGFLSAFGKLIFEDKLAVEMDKIYTKIQNLSMHRPTSFSGESRSPIRCQKSTVPSLPPPTTHELDLASFGDDVQAMMTRLLTDDEFQSDSNYRYGRHRKDNTSKVDFQP